MIRSPSDLGPQVSTPEQVGTNIDADVKQQGLAHRDAGQHQQANQVIGQDPQKVSIETKREMRNDVVAKSGESGASHVTTDAGRADHELTDRLLARAGFERGTDGSLRLRDSIALLKPTEAAVAARAGLYTSTAAMQSLGPPPVVEPGIDGAALASFTDALGRAVDDVMTNPAGTYRGVDSIAADSLLAAFIKLNVLNPLDSVEMQNQLDEAMTNLQQQMILEMKKKIENLFKQLEEALASAMSGLFAGAIMAAIVAAIVAALIVGIIAAIIVAVVIMVVMQMVISQIKAQAQAEMKKARAEADRMAKLQEEVIKDQIAKIREEEMRKIMDATPVGPNGEPLTDEEVEAQLQPALVDAVIEVTSILDAEGAGAAEDRGPQIIHDAMYDELRAMGLSHENADSTAWLIAQETMLKIAAKFAPKEAPPTGEPVNPTPLVVDDGRDAGDALGNAGNIGGVGNNDLPDLIAIDPGTGRDTGDVMSSFTAGLVAALDNKRAELEAVFGSAAIQDAQKKLAGRVDPGLEDILRQAIQTSGVEETLRAQVLNERSIAPFAMLGMTAVVEGGVGQEEVLRAADLEEVTRQLAQSSDRALAALAEVGRQTELASFTLNNPSHV